MEIKYTPHHLKKLEEKLAEVGYKVRYEKGNFKTGYCLLEHKKVVVINKFVPIESRINSLTDILNKVNSMGQLILESQDEIQTTEK